MEAKLSPQLGIAILLGVAVLFAANHVGARIAFDHGASVAAAVATRATGTALIVLVLMRLRGVPLALPRGQRAAALLAGALIAVQSYCLYSAVALIPAALALLVFQTCPILFVLLSWATGKETPRLGTFAAMLLALCGLALALEVRIGTLSERWATLGAGVSWAFGAAIAFACVYYLNTHALRTLDGRLRTFVMTLVTAVLVLLGGGAASALSLPADAPGWIGFALLTLFYAGATTSLFIVLPRLGSPTSTAALNFEVIALLGLAWLFLGQAVSSMQVLGACVVAGAIAWLGVAKR